MLTVQVDGTPMKARLAPEQALPATGSEAWLQVMTTHTCFYKDEELV
jgi:glycerol transport system ATP-binding protein